MSKTILYIDPLMECLRIFWSRNSPVYTISQSLSLRPVIKFGGGGGLLLISSSLARSRSKVDQSKWVLLKAYFHFALGLLGFSQADLVQYLLVLFLIEVSVFCFSLLLLL